jgi:hypothetical protein
VSRILDLFAHLAGLKCIVAPEPFGDPHSGRKLSCGLAYRSVQKVGMSFLRRLHSGFMASEMGCYPCLDVKILGASIVKDIS